MEIQLGSHGSMFTQPNRWETHRGPIVLGASLGWHELGISHDAHEIIPYVSYGNMWNPVPRGISYVLISSHLFSPICDIYIYI